MLKPTSSAAATRFWSEELGAERFPANSVIIRAHRPDLLQSLDNRIFCLAVDTAIFVTAPSEVVTEIHAVSEHLRCAPFECLLRLFENRGQVVGSGPAYIGYRDLLIEHPTSTVTLSANDSRVDALKSAQAVDWGHFGYSPDSRGPFARIDGDLLLGLSHYKIWGGTIAHIGVIVDRNARGRGIGGEVVAAALNDAITNGFLPQYRTLHSNIPSIRIAERLGFTHFGDSLVIRYGKR